jgi:23S rRNA pseudouridine2605 synthase
VKVSGQPSEEAIEKLRKGIALPPRSRATGLHPSESKVGARSPASATREKAVKTAPAKIRLLKEAANPWYEVTLIEGRNRQIRRMFEQVGHHVEKIRRVRYGPLELDIEPGKYRPLTPAELGNRLANRRDAAPMIETGRRTFGTGQGLVLPEANHQWPMADMPETP